MPNYSPKERADLDALYAERVKQEADKGNPFFTLSFGAKMQIVADYFAMKDCVATVLKAQPQPEPEPTSTTQEEL